EAYRDDCLPIGSVTTDGEGRLLSRGRNRIYSERAVAGHTKGSTLAHAEVEALGKVDYDAFDPHTGVLYTTLEPCPMCMGAFYISGFRNIHFAARDPYAGSVDLLGTTPYLQRKSIQVMPPFDPDLEAVLIALFMEFELVRSRGRIRETVLYRRWREVVPAGVALGEQLAQTGEIRRQRLDLSAEMAYDWLMESVQDSFG
ncbi:MAG: nucleoside deaminase, partial [Chloroflexota bacterium]